jgi:hypothetical protein
VENRASLAPHRSNLALYGMNFYRTNFQMTAATATAIPIA